MARGAVSGQQGSSSVRQKGTLSKLVISTAVSKSLRGIVPVEDLNSNKVFFFLFFFNMEVPAT